jgi:hypothetical protein
MKMKPVYVNLKKKQLVNLTNIFIYLTKIKKYKIYHYLKTI